MVSVDGPYGQSLIAIGSFSWPFGMNIDIGCLEFSLTLC